MNTTDIQEKLLTIENTVATSTAIERSLADWRPVLAEECQVYVYNENYLAKRFDQINYKFCDAKTATEILKDNLFALLRFKYFPVASDEVDDRIKNIVSSFITNIKTSLIRVSFDKDSDCKIVKWLPDSCIAFRNGVFDFKNNNWLFKYDRLEIPKLRNTIYEYDPQYVIMWYMNIDFEPLPFDINKNSLETFIEFMKEQETTDDKNICFELMYNMAHDVDDNYDFKRFKHLCEILGYTILQSFSQHFVILIGSGQNGKNSLFDGCFTSRVIPQPANNDMNAIEEDKFITGALENRAQNIFLETDADTKTKSKMLKALTGGMYQTVEAKGENKYSSIINCKYIWAGNDQDKIKFSDNTEGFRRRINLFEIYYKWDADKRFLKRGDYYETNFSDDLHELKEDICNYYMFIYFGMYGIISATNNFTKPFKFTENDWRLQYTDIDVDLKEKLELITPEKLRKFIKSSPNTYSECRTIMYDLDKTIMYNSKTMKEIGISNYEDFVDRFLADEELFTDYFVNYDCYISIRALQKMISPLDESVKFTQKVKKIYGITNTTSLYNNKPYVKARFDHNRLLILH